MMYMRAIPGKMRTDEVYAAAFDSIAFINIGLDASKTGCGRQRGDPVLTETETAGPPSRIANFRVLPH